jgi:hypothetical protein
MVFLKEKLGFQGPGEAPERRKARPFPGGAPGAPREGLLQDFGDFWPPSGVPRGARFPLVSVFSGASKPTKKRENSGGGGGPESLRRQRDASCGDQVKRHFLRKAWLNTRENANPATWRKRGPLGKGDY